MRKIDYIEDFSTWEREFVFFMPTKVRFSETDMFGHLNNKVPFTYFEEARIEFFKELRFMQEWTKKDAEAMIVVANLQCDYLKQVFFDEPLKVYVKVQSIGASSADLHYMVKNDRDEVCLVGRSTMVQASKKTGKSLPWPEEWKQKMKK
ncbi:thioesterase family protein [Ectobacillus antri]|jgi:acyl-CoA thioester hydrolase|uniref:Thioesterase family protein n=1 Tax=Ectobacillus antri TaxID=2486280 RepID=A0ABT6H3U2_9BACI|nr:thioesterase family protein [Ectobacillus antri]MDG4656587.1 thioesterase family protein [Ectobacillus antri]MDG5753637.1 thioesterase family protein [Ectobacillus antri]